MKRCVAKTKRVVRRGSRSFRNDSLRWQHNQCVVFFMMQRNETPLRGPVRMLLASKGSRNLSRSFQPSTGQHFFFGFRTATGGNQETTVAGHRKIPVLRVRFESTRVAKQDTAARESLCACSPLPFSYVHPRIERSCIFGAEPSIGWEPAKELFRAWCWIRRVGIGWLFVFLLFWDNTGEWFRQHLQKLRDVVGLSVGWSVLWMIADDRENLTMHTENNGCTLHKTSLGEEGWGESRWYRRGESQIREEDLPLFYFQPYKSQNENWKTERQWRREMW